MTFTWNVPGGTAPAALVVRADATPEEVARAALGLLDTVLEQAADAIDGPEVGDLRLELDGDDLILVIAGEEDWHARVSAAWGKLEPLGITQVRWWTVTERTSFKPRVPVDGVDNPT